MIEKRLPVVEPVGMPIGGEREKIAALAFVCFSLASLSPRIQCARRLFVKISISASAINVFTEHSTAYARARTHPHASCHSPVLPLLMKKSIDDEHKGCLCTSVCGGVDHESEVGDARSQRMSSGATRRAQCSRPTMANTGARGT